MRLGSIRRWSSVSGMRSIITVACATTLQIAVCSILRAQETCGNGFKVLVAAQDQTGASIQRALVVIDEKTVLSVGADGRYLASCVHQATHKLKVSANSFADQEANFPVSRNLDLKIMLHLGTVETTVNVGEENAAMIESSVTSTGPTQTISGKQLETLADDPDDLLRELQWLSAAGGGAPASATSAVDGFEGNETGAKLPPKSSIASIKIDPDLSNSEYRNPPLSGSRIEVTTKAGQKAFHGTIFMTNSSPWMNARDPFSTANLSLGKQRYGFDLAGPLHGRTSDFLLSLERRDISDNAVVNAIALDSAGTQTPVLQTVTAPQHLWNGLTKTSWQIGSKNVRFRQACVISPNRNW